MDDTNLEELEKQILDAILAKEGDFEKLSNDVDQIKKTTEEAFDAECAKLDAWFEGAIKETPEAGHGELQAKYRADLAALSVRLNKEMETLLAEIVASLVKNQI